VVDLIDNEQGDTVTASPNSGIAGDTITLAYTVANKAQIWKLIQLRLPIPRDI